MQASSQPSFGLTPFVVSIKIVNGTMVLDPPLQVARQHWLTGCAALQSLV
jgi:hypothetical protein